MMLTPTTGELKIKKGVPIPLSHTMLATGPRNYTGRIVRVPIPQLSSHAERTKGIYMAFGYLHLSDGGTASSLKTIEGNGTNSVQRSRLCYLIAIP